ncbi:hypothetical protein KKE26_07410 [bacterium]|nr:hypothetical protein [bacterium]
MTIGVQKYLAVDGVGANGRSPLPQMFSLTGAMNEKTLVSCCSPRIAARQAVTEWEFGTRSIQHIVLISAAGAIYGIVLPLIISSVTTSRLSFRLSFRPKGRNLIIATKQE